MKILKKRRDGVTQTYNKKSWYVTKMQGSTTVFPLKRNPTVKQIENAYRKLPGVYYLGYTRKELENILKNHYHKNVRFVEI